MWKINHKKYLDSDIEEYNKLEKKPILFVRNLRKKYFGRKAPAIQDISFNVYPGEFHAFIGANGAGKTTTIKSLIGAYEQWSGTILIGGVKNNQECAKKRIGYIPESARFPENFSTIKYLEWMTKLSGFTPKEAKKIAEKKLKSLNMWNLRNKSPNGFSSGQKKKILLAQALIHDPDIIIMDEPVANLDPKARTEFFDELIKLKKKGKAIFISSHVLAELQLYYDSATILDGGKIVYTGISSDLMKMFGDDGFEFETTDDKTIKKYLKKKKIKFIEDGKHGLSIFSNDKNVVLELEKFAVANDIEIVKMNKISHSLDEIYDKLIIKGSVDTMN